MKIKLFLIEDAGVNLPPDENGIGHRVYRRIDTGEEISSPLPAGACFYSTENYYRKGRDGRALIVVLPNGHWWNVHSKASNCKKPDDLDHYCWCLHGEAPECTADTNCADWCGAGGGSIQMGDYHGHLQKGYLIDA